MSKQCNHRLRMSVSSHAPGVISFRQSLGFGRLLGAALGIRGRLQIFAIVVAVPLAIVGVIALLGIWSVSRAQLKESVKQQAELATIAFDRWVQAQAEPLNSIAMGVEQAESDPSLGEDLRGVMHTRPHWIDVRIVSTSGQTIVAEPAGAEPPPSALIEYLISQTKNRNFWMASDRTSSLAQPVIAVAVPTTNGGGIIARIEASALDELFRNIQFNDRSVIGVFDPEGHILFRRQTTETPIDREVSSSSLFVAAGKDGAALIELESPYDGVRRIYGVRAGAMDSVVILGIPSSVLYQPARRRFMSYLFFSLLTFACALIAGMFLARGITRPIRQLRETAQRFGANQVTVRAAVEYSGEIGELAQSFNEMADKIVEREEKLKELDRLKSEFVGNVSHELRTPLTTIKTLTYVLQRKMNGNTSLRAHLETIASECDRQIDFVSNLLDLSRIEAGAFKISLVRVNASEVLTSCVSRLRHNAEARRQQLMLELPGELPMVRADHSALRRVLCNLIENAIKYTPDGGRITVGALAEHSEVIFYVQDTGPGVRESDSAHIFDKFYQAGGTNPALAHPSPEQAGVGLGLYIVQSILKQLGGRIAVGNAAQGGAIFAVHLPTWDLQPETLKNDNGSQG